MGLWGCFPFAIWECDISKVDENTKFASTFRTLAWDYGSNWSGVPVSAVRKKSHIAILAPPRVTMLTDVLIGSKPCSTPKYIGRPTLRQNYVSRKYFPGDGIYHKLVPRPKCTFLCASWSFPCGLGGSYTGFCLGLLHKTYL